MQFEQELIRAITAAGIPAPPNDEIHWDTEKFQRWKKHPKDSSNSCFLIARTDGERAYASFGMWGSGRIEGKWHSSNADKNWVRETSRQIAKDREAETRQRAKDSMTRLEAEWNEADPVSDDNFYLQEKWISAGSVAKSLVRQRNNMLIVAMFSDKGKMVNGQRIFQTNEGTLKRFYPALPAKGSYTSVGGRPKPGSRVWIAEGWATAHTVHRITGCTCIVAFSAEWMREVARTIATKYPDNPLGYAADNGSVGIAQAEAAAERYPGIISHPLEVSDWNDAMVEYGLEAAGLQFEDNQREVSPDPKAQGVAQDDEPQPEAISDSTPPPEPEPEATPAALAPDEEYGDWRDNLIWVIPKKDPAYLKICRNNQYLFIENHPDFAGMLIYDLFHEDCHATHLPSWMRNDRPGVDFPRTLEETEYMQMMLRLSRHRLGEPDTKDIRAMCITVSKNHPRHPLLDRLQAAQWDGVQRIDNWLTRYLGAEETDYTRLVGRKFLILALRRLIEPGCKADTMLVLEGAQGVGKSTAASVLAYGCHTDEHLRPDDRYAPLAMAGKWIIEMAEITSIRKNDAETMKAFISRQVDKFHPPYRELMWRPRQCVFIGTTNEVTYLQDGSGNRRYWPVMCGQADIAALTRDRDQLWAEALLAEAAGEDHWVSSEDLKLAIPEQEKRQVQDPWDIPIARYIHENKLEGITIPELLVEVIWREQGVRQATRQDRLRVGQALKQLGWAARDNRRVKVSPRYGASRVALWTARENLDLPAVDIVKIQGTQEIPEEADV